MAENAIAGEKANEIVERLERAYPNSKLTLNFRNAFELLIATILAAQYKDVLVNKITSKLFHKFQSPKDFANADLQDIEKEISTVFLYKVKAKRIKEVCEVLVRKYNSRVPETMEDLTSLTGVGRKTANVVLANALGKVVGIEVDRHIGRVSYRLGLTKNLDPQKIEQDLMNILSKRKWLKFTYVAKDHGRVICKSSAPYCSKCLLNDLCPKNGISRRL